MSDSEGGAKNQMWGGRFARGPSAIMAEINASIDVDRRLWREDIAGSKAHAAMLAKQNIITVADAEAIAGGLDAIAGEIERGEFVFSRELEDIHLNIEARLKELIGAAAGRLHTARSRNDQVATDFKLWTKNALEAAHHRLMGLQSALVRRAEEYADAAMPGLTHLQTAQPVTLGHHLLAYVEMFERDASRAVSAGGARMSACPLGAAALAGTSFPIDRQATAKALGFSEPMANSMDAVSARDFALEALAVLSIAATHLSRLAEEIVLWTSPQFAFARLSDEWSTGSSIMPQKRNPDAAELVRAKAARITANFAGLSAIVQKLPLAYAKDLQEDKSLVFEAFDAFDLSILAITGMVGSMTFDRERMRAAAEQGYSTATDLADWMARALGAPFRDAHHVAGRIVALAEKKGVALDALSLDDMQSVEPRIAKDVFSVLSVEASVASRTSYGGTAPDNVRKEAARWRERLSMEKSR